MAAAGLRIRLLEPAVGVVSGGTRVLIHGRGFRPAPHSLLVRFRLAETTFQTEVAAKFLLESQLQVVVPSLEHAVKQTIAKRTNLAASSASVSSAPQIVKVAVEVVLDATVVSNELEFSVHQALAIRRISPQYVLMAPPTAITLTLNTLKLPNRTAAAKDQHEPLDEITTLPVFVRVTQKAERSGIPSEQTRPGRWSVTPQGVYEVAFDGVMLGYGPASVDISLNRVEYFRGSDRAPESLGYQVQRDAMLKSLEPCSICVTSGLVIEARIFGSGFVDSSDLVVALDQRELPRTGDVGSAAPLARLTTIAQVSATFVSKEEIRCSVQANLPFGLTTFRVSLNGGKQFGSTGLMALLYRGRAFESVSPQNGTLDGDTRVCIRHSCLPLEAIDALSQVQNLVPPKKVRVRFQAVNDDGSAIDGMGKTVFADGFGVDPANGAQRSDRGMIFCRTPSFLEELKTLQAQGRKVAFDYDGDVPLRVKRFMVSIALGSDPFFGAIEFAYYYPPIIRSITRHHGPSTGGTFIIIRMKHKVPQRLALLVRFHSLESNKCVVVSGERYASFDGKIGEGGKAFEQFDFDSDPIDDDPERLIYCSSPAWTDTEGLPHLTKLQVSYDGGTEYFPLDSPELTISSRGAKAFHQSVAHAMTRDLSYLYFLFYKPPTFTSVLPMSADISGGSSIRIMGEDIVDHGAQVSVVFHSPQMCRKVLGFVEKGEVRCCAPPFNVGPVAVFVSLNSMQYTKCRFQELDSSREVDFVFYSSPSIQSISPLCACIAKSSVISIMGRNLIETGRIKVRFAFVTSHGKSFHKDVPGRARNGVITASSPIFSNEFAHSTAAVDVALNGNDFTGTSVSLHYFSSYEIQTVDPPLGAAEISVALSLQVAPAIVADLVFVRVRFASKLLGEDKVFGPEQLTKWTDNSLQFTLPPVVSFVSSLDDLGYIAIDLSFDGENFHDVGNLLSHYKAYNMPNLASMSPLFGAFSHETQIVAQVSHLHSGHTVKFALYLENAETSGTAKSKQQTPAAVVVAEVHPKRQALRWSCPRLSQLAAKATAGTRVVGRMILAEHVSLQISVVDGQPMRLPFVFRYYHTPTLLSMDPCIGYTCSGSIISFEFTEPIETPTIDFRFGESQSCSGRIRDGRYVECFSPEVTKGVHDISVSFNEQHFEPLLISRRSQNHDNDEDKDGEADAADGSAGSKILTKATFRAFSLPVFLVPRNEERICGFGPMAGGTIVLIKGLGFIPGTKIYVRFASPHRDGLGDGSTEMVVKAGVIDERTIQCTAPPSMRLGKVGLHVSYNLQQFIDSTCFFEYHRPTMFARKSSLCGPVSGNTSVCLAIQNEDGLPVDRSVVECAVRFTSDKTDHFEDVAAAFNPDSLLISCVAPVWTANELVRLLVTLSHGPFEQFVDSRIQYLFYDPPDGIIRIEPCAGPISGGTTVLAWCGQIVDTGEITVSVTMGQPGVKATAVDSSATLDDPSGGEELTLTVKGKIVGDAVSFVTPPVLSEGTAYLNFALNGINYTAARQNSSLAFVYYVSPIIRRISPGWMSVESPAQLRISGDYITDYSCEVRVRFAQQQASEMHESQDEIEVEGQFLAGDPTGESSLSIQVECNFPPLTPGFYQVEVSLNGQQFSNSQYMRAAYGNFSGAVCTALLPLRVFASPFFLATSTGPAAGGSAIVLVMSKRLVKLLTKESKCQVQFTPTRTLGDSSTNVLTTVQRGAVNPGIDPVTVTAEIDQSSGKVTCRAPLLRVACVATVDLLLPAAAALPTPKEKERYYSYESPTITEIVPSCGPMSGGSSLIIEATNIFDTGQVFVRFRSVANERECVVIPATYSRRYPDGSLSSSPLIICQTPVVEFVDKAISEPGAPTSTSTASPCSPNSTTQISTNRRTRDTITGKTRVQTFQQLAEQSMQARSSSVHDGGLAFRYASTLRLTRVVPKTGSSMDIISGATVLVDFTLNGGEQFIAHSVKFHYYGELDPNEIKWGPRHMPSRNLGRSSTQVRTITVQLPKSVRVNEAIDRISFRFEGEPLPILAKRRGSSIVLHEMNPTRELLSLDAPRLRTQATSRRRSTIMRNTSMSASSTSLLSLATVPSALAPFSSQAGPPSRGETKPRIVAPTFQAPRQPSGSHAPFIAGKMLATNEITCPVPDFSAGGPVKVFMSLNAQQFVCLGEMHFHDPISISEEEQFRYFPNRGGNRFSVRSSISTILSYVMPSDVMNEVQQRASASDRTIAKLSRALMRDILNAEIDASEDGDDGLAADLKESPHNVEGGSGKWQMRSYCAFHVALVPPNPSLLANVAVTAVQAECMQEMGTQASDPDGCCVFEVTEWYGDMVLRATLPPGTDYCSFSTPVCRSDVMAKDSIDDENHGMLQWSTTPEELPIILTRRPTPDRVSVVLFTSAPETTVMDICLLNGCSVDRSPSITAVTGGSIQHLEVDREVISSGVENECVVCVTMKSDAPAAHDSADAVVLSDMDPAHVQVLVVSSSGDQICLTGVLSSQDTWVVARIQANNSDQDPLLITRVDRLIDSTNDIRTISSEPNLDITLDAQTMIPSAYLVPVYLHFTCADSSANRSVSSRAKVILQGDNEFSALAASPCFLEQVKIECVMPALTFSGLTNVTVSMGGMVFSNFVCIHCYDPRSWHVRSVEPACGLVREPLSFRILGEHFVETHKILVRFSDEERYFSVHGAVERRHILILTIAAVKNVRGLLSAMATGSVGASGDGGSRSPQKRDDDKAASSAAGTAALMPASYTLTVRIQCDRQSVFASCRESAVATAVASATALSWEEQLELGVAPRLDSPLLITVEVSDGTLPKPLELATGVLALDGLQEGATRRKTAKLERHFHRGSFRAPDSNNSISPEPVGEVELAMHLSPLLQQPECIACTVERFDRPDTLDVQVSSGDNLFSPLFDSKSPGSPGSCFRAYELPTVLSTSPVVLPRSVGGEILITGSGFIDPDGTGRVCVRLFCCRRANYDGLQAARRVLDAINRANRLQVSGGCGDFFVRDIDGTTTSSSTITCVIPAFLATYNIFYRLSFDGRAFTTASPATQILLFSVDSIDPKGGPTSGNTYAALGGININTCLTSRAVKSKLSPLVRLAWMRGTKELESVLVTGEFYPPDDAIYFYTPQSRFGLQNISVSVELAVVGTADNDNAVAPRFSRDEISFIMYKVPSIRGVAPSSALVCGLSQVEVAVQGFDEKATRAMKPVFKLRFKLRGQMQVSDVFVVSDTRFDCVVPRFNVIGATATEILGASRQSPRIKAGPGGGMNALRGSPSPCKIWTRTAGVIVVLLGARQLRASKKHTCNPFAIITFAKTQLKSTRKDGATAPVWNEVFDFEMAAPAQSSSAPTIRVVLENQLTIDQSEFLGQVEICLSEVIVGSPFAFRAWLPLRRLKNQKADTVAVESSGKSPRQVSGRPSSVTEKDSDLGEVEVAVSFLPPVAATHPRSHRVKIGGGGGVGGTQSLRRSILSVISSQISSRKAGNTGVAPAAPTMSRKERLLRVFKQKGPPTSLVPTELQVELALNGQDFWSPSPTRLYTVPPPIILSAEPAFISIAGGTTVSICGLNFVNSGAVRVAFVLTDANAAPTAAQHSQTTDRAVIVDAKYRSTTSLVCVSPQLEQISTGDTSAMRVKLIVSLNGFDFDCLSLPRQSVKPMLASTDNSSPNEKVAISKRSKSPISIALEREQYVVKFSEFEASESAEPHASTRRDCVVRMYQIPKILCVRPTDGVYTSRVTFEGSNFTDTSVAVARFTSLSDEKDTRSSKLLVASPTRMECNVPDFPRDTVVRIEVSMNGVEYFAYPHELRLFQAPRLTEVVPSWISAGSTIPLLLRGINLTAASIPSTDSSVSVVRVSIARGRQTRIISSACDDGEVHCDIPRELLQVSSSGSAESQVAPDGSHELRPLLPIQLDIQLSGKTRALSGKPVTLNVYRRVPTVLSVSPMNGPVYGGFSIVVEGSGFVNTGNIVVRFQFFPLPTSNDEPNNAKTDGQPIESVPFVDTAAKFVSPERVLLPAPTFPQEGVYVVLVALNGVEFCDVNEATWYLAWQNWQRRKRLLQHELFAAPLLAREVRVSVAAPALVGALDETKVSRLRRKSSFMLPQIKGATRASHSPGTSPTRTFDPLAADEDEQDLAEFANPKLLHWHPASAADEKGRPLLALLETLCNSPESQKIVCRRLRVVFRMKGEPSQSAAEGGERSPTSGANVAALGLSYPAFARGLRLIFPHALERDLETVWAACDGTSRGRLNFASLMRRVMYPPPDTRCASPEPGPTHYVPLYDIVSPRVPAAVVLPQSVEPEVPSGLPSELFIDYDAAYKAVRPAVPGGVFPKRKFNTSWCNPVAQEEAAAVRTPRPPSRTPTSASRPLRIIQPSTNALTSVSESLKAAEGDGLQFEEEVSSPPTTARVESVDVEIDLTSTGEISEDPRPHRPADLLTEDATVLPRVVKDDGVRSPRGAKATSTPTPISARGDANRRLYDAMIDRRLASGVPPTGHGHSAFETSSNLFYDDIAPMYLKFLRSKEIQKLMKLDDDEATPSSNVRR